MGYSLSIFDLDGVLFDTRDAVIKAYVLAGMRRDIVECNWGRAWREWCDPVTHGKKSIMYRGLLASYARPLPALEKYRRTRNAFVLTGASASAVLDLSHEFRVDLKMLGTSHTTNDKRRVLRNLERAGHRGIYVDDMLELGLQITRPLQNFKLCHAKSDGSIDVYHQGVIQCTLSSWQEDEVLA